VFVIARIGLSLLAVKFISRDLVGNQRVIHCGWVGGLLEFGIAVARELLRRGVCLGRDRIRLRGANLGRLRSRGGRRRVCSQRRVEDAAGAIGIADEHQDFGWEEDRIDPKFEEFPGFSFHTIT
jgi:hypothetical protein